MGHRSPSHQWDVYRHSWVLLIPVWARGTGISLRVLTSTYYFTDKLERPEHGSRLRIMLIVQDFRDARACLRYYTIG